MAFNKVLSGIVKLARDDLGYSEDLELTPQQNKLASSLFDVIFQAVRKKCDITVRNENGQLEVVYRHSNQLNAQSQSKSPHISGISVDEPASNSSFLHDVVASDGSQLGHNEDDTEPELISNALSSELSTMDSSCANDASDRSVSAQFASDIDSITPPNVDADLERVSEVEPKSVCTEPVPLTTAQSHSLLNNTGALQEAVFQLPEVNIPSQHLADNDRLIHQPVLTLVGLHHGGGLISSNVSKSHCRTEKNGSIVPVSDKENTVLPSEPSQTNQAVNLAPSSNADVTLRLTKDLSFTPDIQSGVDSAQGDFLLDGLDGNGYVQNHISNGSLIRTELACKSAGKRPVSSSCGERIEVTKKVRTAMSDGSEINSRHGSTENIQAVLNSSEEPVGLNENIEPVPTGSRGHDNEASHSGSESEIDQDAHLDDSDQHQSEHDDIEHIATDHESDEAATPSSVNANISDDDEDIGYDEEEESEGDDIETELTHQHSPSPNNSDQDDSEQLDSDRDDSGQESNRSPVRSANNSMRSTSDESSDDIQVPVGAVILSTPKESPAEKMRSRKLMAEEELEFETREAMQEEEARLKRVAKKQGMFDQIYNEAVHVHVSSSDANTVQRLILDIDARTKQVTVEVEPKLASVLHPHQVAGIKFLYDCVIESVEQVIVKRSPGSGCVLAHSMGLGKTLQTIAFLYTIHTNRQLKKYFERSLVVAPTNCKLNWVAEFKQWLTDYELTEVICHNFYEVTNKKDGQRERMLEYWRNKGGVLIMSHSMFEMIVNQMSNENCAYPRSYVKTIRRCLVNPGPDVVVVDEGHFIKNRRTKLYGALSKVNTLRRIIMTGTPLQNNLLEYRTMADYVKPNCLGTEKEFRNQFANPIKNGSSKDSAPIDVQIMKERSSVLTRLLEGFVQRFDYKLLEKYLKPKIEYIIYVRLLDAQRMIYKKYMDNFYKIFGTNIFQDQMIFRSICAHPSLLYKVAEKARSKQLDDEAESSESSECEDDEPSLPSKTSKQELTNVKRNAALGEESWFNEYVSQSDYGDAKFSSKLTLLLEMFIYCRTHKEKIVVFSQQLVVLDLIEYCLKQINDDPTSGKNKLKNWKLNVNYFRIDGKRSAEQRMSDIDMFNDPKNTRARLFLLSTRAGSVGINLHGANRCVIFDVSWNPWQDVQALFRIFRFGQTKQCYIYRFVCKGTMEERVYEGQVIKESLAARVVDKKNIERHFNDGNRLYDFDEFQQVDAKIPRVPRDDLLKELEMNDITSYYMLSSHEHDSLLNHTEDGLSAEEGKAAWEAFYAQRGLGNEPSGPEAHYWKEPANSLLDNLIDDDDSAAILGPVDLDKYPDYGEHVRMHMDLVTMKEKLTNEEYKTPKELKADMELLSSNVLKYDPYSRALKTFVRKLKLQFDDRMKTIMEDHRRAVVNAGKGKSNQTPVRRRSYRKRIARKEYK